MTSPITDEQMRQVFDIFDADGSGYVEVEELGLAMQALGIGPLAKADTDALVKDFCAEGTVQVDLREFKRMAHSRIADRDSSDEAVKNFHLFLESSADPRSEGTVKASLNVEDLLVVARQVGELPPGDVVAESRLRNTFERVIAASSSYAASESQDSIDLPTWVRVMRESVSDKRHRVRDTSSYHIRTRAKVAKRGPYGSRVEEGKTYHYCTCGMSKSQPFCDGSHVAFNLMNGSNFQPIAYEADSTRTVWFCGCKQSKNLPFCDGSHSSLPPE
jgi:CDGSH-type Zn-finger protein